MRILHTSDWHLGKTLEGFSRLEEQEKFTEEIIHIVKEKQIDLVLIAGDVYDSSNPPAAAETLFYKTLQEITEDNKTGVIVISGNHDNPDRLTASSPIAAERGIILLGTPKSYIEKGKYGCIEVIDSGAGFIEIQLNGERSVIITIPYPSEKRLNEIFTEELKEGEKQKSYSERIGQLFDELSLKYREDTINIAVSHVYISGGEVSDSERPIQIGGSYAIEADKLPQRAQYVALGHLHRPQKVKFKDSKIYYSGSPLQYSKSEIAYSKCAYIVDVKAKSEAQVEEVMLKNYKPIEIWKCESIEQAIKKCRDESGKSVWVYLDIKTDRVINQSEMKEMRDLQPSIIEIRPEINCEEDEIAIGEDINEKGEKEMFTEFYKSRRGVEPSEELTDLFLKITLEDGADET